jgi:hypothetical protein
MSETAGVPSHVTRTLHHWRTDQLPPVVHEMVTVDGRRLVVRVILPGQRFGLTATLGTPGALVEVRRAGLIEDAMNLPGDLVAVWDLTLLLEEPRAHWVVLTDGMRYACTEDALADMYASLHAAGGGD